MTRIGYVTFAEGIWTPLLRRQVTEVLDEIQRQSSEKWSITLIAFISWHSYIIEREELNDVRQELDQSNIELITVPVPIPIPYYSFSKGVTSFWKYSWYSIPIIMLFGAIPLLYYSSKQNIKIIHSRSYPAGLISMIVAKFRGDLKFVFDPRSDFPEENVTSGNWTRDSTSFSLWKYLESMICDSSDSVIAISESFIDHLDRTGVDVQFDKIQNNVDTSEFVFNNTFRDQYRTEHGLHNDTIVVYSGSMSSQGGITLNNMQTQ
nr:glycosyltransferase [Haloferax sp. BAB-2207]